MLQSPMMNVLSSKPSYFLSDQPPKCHLQLYTYRFVDEDYKWTKYYLPLVICIAIRFDGPLHLNIVQNIFRCFKLVVIITYIYMFTTFFSVFVLFFFRICIHLLWNAIVTQMNGINYCMSLLLMLLMMMMRSYTNQSLFVCCVVDGDGMI